VPILKVPPKQGAIRWGAQGGRVGTAQSDNFSGFPWTPLLYVIIQTFRHMTQSAVKCLSTFHLSTPVTKIKIFQLRLTEITEMLTPMCIVCATVHCAHCDPWNNESAKNFSHCGTRVIFFWLQSDGGISSDWCIYGGNHSQLLGKEVWHQKKKKKKKNLT
jgi:hypothetical protein